MTSETQTVQPITQEQLELWKGLEREATAGPWSTDAVMDDTETEIVLGYEIPGAGSPIMLAATFDDDDEGPGRITPREARNNARFIAASRTALPALISECERLRGLVQIVIRNSQHVDDTRRRSEPGPLCGPTWAKVAHLFDVGSTSAIGLCEAFGVNPHFDCSKEA